MEDSTNNLESRIQNVLISEIDQALVKTPHVAQSGSDEDNDIITMADINWGTLPNQELSQPAPPIVGNRQVQSNGRATHWPQSGSWTDTFQPCNLVNGVQVEIGLALCPFKLMQVYPHRFVGRANGEKVSRWFKDNIFLHRSWDMYYIRDPCERRDPLILVPTAQFSQLLRDVNTEFGLCLSIPTESKNGNLFEIYFGEFPRPRFMGKVGDEKSYRDTKEALGITLDDPTTLDHDKLHQFKQKMDVIYDSIKSSKNKKDPEKQRLKAISRQKGWGQTIKRAQRYLGLRQRLSRAPYSDDTNAHWDVACKAPFDMESSVKFVCVDVEANEMSNSAITEIGLAIIDTEDIEDVPPGEKGKNWLPHIEAHHLRIEEYKTIVNSKYVQGCPDAFNFGRSEFVAQRNVCQRLREIIGESNSKYKSNIVMVGHEAIADLKYLQNLGYNMWNLENLLDEVDTKQMFQRLQFSTDGRSLEFVCQELGMPGNNFHNAGNDAMYTLRAMIAMAVKKKVGGPLTESEKAGWVFNAKLEEWSDGEQDDGGAAVKSAAPAKPMEQPAQVARAPITTPSWWL